MIKSWNAKTEVKHLGRVYVIELTHASMFSAAFGAWAHYHGFVSINTVDTPGARPTFRRVARLDASFVVAEHQDQLRVQLYPMDSASRITESVTHFLVPRPLVNPVDFVREHIAILAHEALAEWKVMHA